MPSEQCLASAALLRRVCARIGARSEDRFPPIREVQPTRRMTAMGHPRQFRKRALDGSRAPVCGRSLGVQYCRVRHLIIHTPDIVMTPRHIGIVACSAEGAALCYRTICVEGAAILGPHAHPEVTVHTPSLADYMAYIYRGDWTGVGELMLASARKAESGWRRFPDLPRQHHPSGAAPRGAALTAALARREANYETLADVPHSGGQGSNDRTSISRTDQGVPSIAPRMSSIFHWPPSRTKS